MILTVKKYLLIVGLFASVSSFAQPRQRIEVVKEVVERTPEKEPTPEAVQQTFESVMINSFKAGNALKISSYFGDNVDLSITDKENLYSRSQAEQILKNFFSQHKPSNFSIMHKGKSGQTQYFIGELKTGDGEFRVTINSKPSGSSTIITSLTIEDN